MQPIRTYRLRLVLDDSITPYSLEDTKNMKLFYILTVLGAALAPAQAEPTVCNPLDISALPECIVSGRFPRTIHQADDSLLAAARLLQQAGVQDPSHHDELPQVLL